MKIKKIEIDKLLIIKYIFYSNIGGNVEFFKNNNIKLYQDDIYKMAYSNDEKLLEYLSYILGRRNIKTINIAPRENNKFTQLLVTFERVKIYLGTYVFFNNAAFPVIDHIA